MILFTSYALLIVCHPLTDAAAHIHTLISSSSEDHHSSQEEYAYFPPQGQSSFYPPPQISPVDPPSGFGPQDIFDYQGEHHDRVQQDLDDVYAMLAPHIQGRTDTPAGVSLKIESPADGPSETGSPIRPHISTGGSRKRKRGTIATKEKSSKKRDSLSEDATKGQAENDDVAQSSSTEASIEGARNSQTLMSDRPPVKPLPKRRRRM